MRNPAIVVRGLGKDYVQGGGFFRAPRKSFSAVEALDFEVEAGEAVAFLGPNGAGKSTTIKMLCGILTPTRGEAKILGHAPGTREASRQLGLVFGTRSQLWLHMNVRDCLRMACEIYAVPPKEQEGRIEHLAERFGASHLLRRRVRALSLGERMRCELVAALVHKPAVLLLDEPTIGLDVVARTELRELLRAWRKENGTTLLLTSHDLADVEKLCGRCLVVDHGRLVFDGTLEGLKGEAAGLRRVRLALSDESEAYLGDPRIAAGATRGLVHDYEFDVGRIGPGEAMASLFGVFGDRVVDVQVVTVSLEEVLASRFARGLGGHGGGAGHLAAGGKTE